MHITACMLYGVIFRTVYNYCMHMYRTGVNVYCIVLHGAKFSPSVQLHMMHFNH